MRPSVHEVLSRYLPVAAVEPVQQLLNKHRIHLTISRDRVSKLGDYRTARNSKPHRISVNGKLNQYAFLLVFLHELAHFIIYTNGGQQLPPHNEHWKKQYGMLIREAVEAAMFHPSLNDLLIDYSYRVRASGTADAALTLALRQFDNSIAVSGWSMLDELPGKAVFKTRNGRTFIKGEKARTRYRCLCVASRRHYLVHQMAEVKKVAG